MSDQTLLADASAQDIQLELIRRRRFNEFDGRLVVASLQNHSDLWVSAFMTMPPHGQKDDPIPFLFLIPLRELPRNHWQVDTLFVLCESPALAEQLREVARSEDWKFDADEIYTGDVVGRAIGEGPCSAAILELWWD